MNKHQFMLFFTLFAILAALIVACAAPPTPTPTPASTATRPPQPTATVPPPTAAPTNTTQPTPSDPAKALATKKQGVVILEDSFEKGTPAEFPAGWTILDQDAQVANKTGPRVFDASALKAPDGKFVIFVQSNPQVDGRMNRDFAATPQGRLFWTGMIPGKDGNFLSLEVRDGGTLMFNLEMHPEGKFRYRDEKGSLQETNVKFALDKWYTLVTEWDATASIWNGYVLDDSGKQVLLTPEKGVPFPDASKGKAPNRVQLRLNRAAQIVGSYIDNIKVYSLQ